MKALLLTGASGFIGGALARAFKAKGWRVLSAGRREPSGSCDDHVAWSLGRELPLDLRQVSLVLHAACATLGARTAARAGSDLDVGGAEVILAQLRAIEADARPRLVFLSSQSAAAGARTAYGQSKFTIEGLLEGPSEIAVRPGLVYGPGAASVFTTLSRLSRAPLMPAPIARAAIQPIHVDDLADALVRIGDREEGPTLWRLGAPRALSLQAVVRALARSDGRRAPLMVPVPATLLRMGAAFSDVTLGSSLSERVGGLLSLQPMRTRADLDLLGVRLRPFRSTEIRARLHEARALMLGAGARCPSFALRPLVRWLRSQDQPDLSTPLTRRIPELLRWTEPFDEGRHRGAAMLRALALRESLEAASRWSFDQGQRQLLVTVIRLIGLFCLETLLVPLRAVGAPRKGAVPSALKPSRRSLAQRWRVPG